MIGRDHHRRPAVEKVPPQVVIRGVTAREGVICLVMRTTWASRKLPVKDVAVIRNWVWCLSWWIVMVFTTLLVYKLVLFPTWLCNRKDRASAHESESVEENSACIKGMGAYVA